MGEVKKRKPTTLAAVQRATDEVQPQLEARYGNLDAETAKVVAFAKTACAVDMG